MFAVVSLLVKGKVREKKKRKKKGGENHKRVQKSGELLGALCSFPRVAFVISNQY